MRIASLSPALWDRTITVGSAGKSFSATGWRVGWCIAPQKLLVPILAVLTRTVFCSVSPLQEAVATGFEHAKEKKFFETQRVEYNERRDLMMSYLDKLGLPYTKLSIDRFTIISYCCCADKCKPTSQSPRDPPVDLRPDGVSPDTFPPLCKPH